MYMKIIRSKAIPYNQIIVFCSNRVSRRILTTYLTVLYCVYSRKFPAVFVLMILKIDTV